MRARRRADRDRAHALPRAGDRLRVVAGGLRDGLHVLRDRPGRLRAPPRSWRDRRAGRARRSTRRRQRVSTSSSWAWASRSRTPTRRWAAVNASTTTSGFRPATSPSATVGVVPGMRRLAQEALPVTLAVSLHAADDDRRDSSCRSTAATRSPRCSTPRPSTPAPRGAGSPSNTRASPASTTRPRRPRLAGRLIGPSRVRRRAREPDSR